MATVEINPDKPISAHIRLLSPDGSLYQPGSSKKVEGPKRVGRPVPSDVPIVPPPEVPSSGPAGIKVLFEFGDHAVTSTFNEVSTSAGGTYLVLDVTGRDDAFIPFHAHLKNHRPNAEVISALPLGGRTAFSLAVTGGPPIGVRIAGRKVYLVPIVETVEVSPADRAEFAAMTETAPDYKDSLHGKERDDRAGHAPGPDGRPGVSEQPDEPAELALPGEDPAPERGSSISSVLAGFPVP